MSQTLGKTVLLPSPRFFFCWYAYNLNKEALLMIYLEFGLHTFKINFRFFVLGFVHDERPNHSKTDWYWHSKNARWRETKTGKFDG